MLDAMQDMKRDPYLLSCLRKDTFAFLQENSKIQNIDLTVYYDYAAFGRSRAGTRGTNVILYVVNTLSERIGTDTDVEILHSMLHRGFAVVVADYHNHENTATTDLDWSVIDLIQNVKSGELFVDDEAFEQGHYHETFLVPAGHNISVGDVFYELDRYGVSGTLDKIVEVWNHDFRSCKGDYVLPWCYKDGRRKATQTAFDGTTPVWYADPKGECPDQECGTYIRAKHTRATDITDCIRPDGSPIDLNLYMHIVYPTNPAQKAPVLVLASSSEHLASGWTYNGGHHGGGRPHSSCFAFRGYAVAVYDYAYVPMVRVDHYGYFDGYCWRGWITGDNMTYSVYSYNLHLVSSAAIRYLRYLSYSGKYAFSDRIGIIGNSKGSEMTNLGDGRLMHTLSLADGYTEESLADAIESKLTARAPRFYLPKHHGETRYEMGESGYTRDGVAIATPERQPYLTYNGREIPSGVQFVYSSCGAFLFEVDEQYAPMFISSNIGKGETAGYYRQNEIVNLCRNYDIPLLWFESMAGHSFITTECPEYRIDPYDAYVRYVNYFLKDDPVTLAYATPLEGEALSHGESIVLQFTGVVTKDEIARVLLTDASGRPVQATFVSSYGGTRFTCLPVGLRAGESYTLTVPADLCGANGREIAAPLSRTFTFTDSAAALTDAPITLTNTRAVPLALTAESGARRTLRLSLAKSAANTVLVYACADCTEQSLISAVPVGEAGDYTLTLTEDAPATLYLKTANPAEDRTTVLPLSMLEAVSPSYFKEVTPPEGTQTRAVAVGLNTFFHGHALYGTYDALKITNPTGAPLTSADYGRRFTLHFSTYDTVSRYFVGVYNSMSDPKTRIIDYRVARYDYHTASGAWTQHELPFTLYHPIHGEAGLGDKTLTFLIQPTGDPELPVHFADFTLTEHTTDVTVSEVGLLCE